METNTSDVLFLKEESAEYGIDLIEELKPLVALHGVGIRRLSNAFKEVRQINDDSNTNGEPHQMRAHLIRMVLWRLFGPKESIWIHFETQAGNPIPSEILVEAYSMWTPAIELAKKYGIDSAAAANAMAKATYATTDRQATIRLQGGSGDIKDIRKYLFMSYINIINKIAAKQGLTQTAYTDWSDWILNNDISDKGAFANLLECSILYNEFLETMDPDVKNIVYARYSLGYSWQQTADYTGIQMKTAQNTMSSAITNAVGSCMQDLRDSDSGMGRSRKRRCKRKIM